MLGQPVSMLIPQVVGVKLTGRLREGATATDLVLDDHRDAAQAWRGGKVCRVFRTRPARFAAGRPRHHRATCRRSMARLAEFSRSTRRALNYLRLTGRSEEQIALVEAYCREQGLFHDENTPEAEYSELLALDLGDGGAESGRSEAPAGSRAALASGRVVSHRAALADQTESQRQDSCGCVPRMAIEKRWEQEGGNPAAIGVEDPNVHEHVSA